MNEEEDYIAVALRSIRKERKAIEDHAENLTRLRKGARVEVFRSSIFDPHGRWVPGIWIGLSQKRSMDGNLPVAIVKIDGNRKLVLAGHVREI